MIAIVGMAVPSQLLDDDNVAVLDDDFESTLRNREERGTYWSKLFDHVMNSSVDLDKLSQVCHLQKKEEFKNINFKIK